MDTFATRRERIYRDLLDHVPAAADRLRQRDRRQFRLLAWGALPVSALALAGLWYWIEVLRVDAEFSVADFVSMLAFACIAAFIVAAVLWLISYREDRDKDLSPASPGETDAAAQMCERHPPIASAVARWLGATGGTLRKLEFDRLVEAQRALVLIEAEETGGADLEAARQRLERALDR